MNEYNYIVAHEFQITKPNGDIDFITVYDLPIHLAERFVVNKYPDCTIENIYD